MIKVLRHMAGYTSIDSSHFSVVVDPAQDDLLGRYMSRYLESIYSTLTTRFGYAPPGRSKIEILKNHQWFSGRTIGLPFVPTVGACTGRVVALASPKATRVPFNWARVLTHELVHVITLQQTEFNIPHWYTEALAVESEGFPRPQEWNRMLLERVPNRKLLNLDTINLGFIRPKEPDDRQMAYCQAQLYARYMLKRFGDDALIKMLMAYRRGLTTDRAIADCFHVAKADFEKGYLAYLDEVLKTIRTRVSEEKPIKFSQLERQVKEKPDDPDLNARMAYEHFARRDFKAARPFAEKALKLKPHHPLASYVKARLLLSIGDDETTALAILEPALDPKQPNERVIDLLAELKMKAGELDEAEKLYELARKDDPFHTKWIAGLARVHLRQKKTAQFLNDLAMIAANDADDIAVRKALAERHLAAGDAAAAEKWANECLYIDVYDPSVHVLLADAQAAGKKYAEAIEEFQTALDAQTQEAQRPEGQASPGPTVCGPARRRQGHARRRLEGRSGASRGQRAASENRSWDKWLRDHECLLATRRCNSTECSAQPKEESPPHVSHPTLRDGAHCRRRGPGYVAASIDFRVSRSASAASPSDGPAIREEQSACCSEGVNKNLLLASAERQRARPSPRSASRTSSSSWVTTSASGTSAPITGA